MDELETLAELLRNVLALVQQLEQEGDSLDDEESQAVTQYITLLTQTIEIRQQTTSTPIEQPPIQEAMPSSNVEGFAYDDKTGRMFVRFLGDHPNRMGPVYQYENVPPTIFNLFRSGAVPARTDGKNKWGQWWKGKVPSLGASLHTLIKTQGYDYRRVA